MHLSYVLGIPEVSELTLEVDGSTLCLQLTPGCDFPVCAKLWVLETEI